MGYWWSRFIYHPDHLKLKLMQPRTILALFVFNWHCLSRCHLWNQIEDQNDPNVTENVVKSDFPTAYSALPSAPGFVCQFKNVGLWKFFRPPLYGSSSVRIDDRISLLITRLLSLQTPWSLMTRNWLTLSSIKVNEIIVSAIKLRSLVPEYVINFDSIRESETN